MFFILHLVHVVKPGERKYSQIETNVGCEKEPLTGIFLNNRFCTSNFK